MKIALKKIPFNKSDFETKLDNLTLKGIFFKEDNNSAKIEATLSGEVEVECIKCLSPFKREINEELKLIITDRVYNGFDEEYDIVEIDSNIIDFDDIITSEIESIKLEYNICDKCKDSNLDVEI
ncbi:MAG: hypothetical protein DSY40_03665 [Nautilia sp.]|nr:MAG: hypothetical protein DSY40_03665 [Nautilia sp.]